MAAFYIDTGDYILLPELKNKRSSKDQEESRKLLEKLGAVSTYKDIVYRTG
jgi:hypothetical protein